MISLDTAFRNVREKREDCCGCSACRFACPAGAITMTEDEEGFSVPRISPELCTECGACLEVCPMAHSRELKETRAPRFFAAKHEDPQVLFHSTSGGAFTALSDAVLSAGGVIYGVDFDESLDVYHARTETAEGRDRMRFSKYVQSRMDDVYEKIQSDLSEKREILFTGTPCQTAAVRSVFGKTEGLYLTDLICHGVPSPLSWKKYREMLAEEQGAPVVWASFRTKENGWFRGQYQIYYRVEGSDARLEDTRFFELYFRKRYLLRPSCYVCPYSDTHRAADLTIADYWGIEKFSEEWCDRRGVSLVLVHTENGESLLSRCMDLLTEERDPSEALSQQGRLSSPAACPPERTEFWKMFRKQGLAAAARDLSRG